MWARNLANGDVAVGLYNKASGAPPPAPPIPGPPCTTWVTTNDSYYEASPSTDNVGQFSGLTIDQAKAACCSNLHCAGFDFKDGSGFYKGNALGGIVKDAGYTGFTKPNQVPKPGPPPSQDAADITVTFSDLNLFGSVEVYDIWAQKSVGVFQKSYTAKQVPFHGTAFLRLKPQ